MNAQHKDFLEAFEATLKARRVASDNLKAIVLDPTQSPEAAYIAGQHEAVLDQRVMDMAAECANMEDAGAGEETELRSAAVALIRRI